MTRKNSMKPEARSGKIGRKEEKGSGLINLHLV
jgi:hypothetical protein